MVSNAAAFWSAIKEGEVRAWESDVGTGTPLGGVVYTRVWFPFYWVGAVVPASAISSFIAWFFLWSAQAGAWFLARRLGIGQWGAILAGLAYGFSGPVTAFVLRIYESALAPWVLAGVHATISRRTTRPIMAASALAFSVAIMWLGGFPAASVFTIYAAAAVAVAYAVMEWGRDIGKAMRRLSVAGLGVIGGTLLVTPLLLPSLEYIHASGSLERSYSSDHAAGLSLFGSSISGRILGTYQFKDFWWPDPGYSNPYEASATVGTVVLLTLAIGALAARRHSPEEGAARVIGRIYLPLGAVVFVGTFLGGPVLAALQQLPYLGSNTFGRSRFLLALALALAAGLVLDGILRRKGHPRRFDWPLRALAGAAVVLALTSAALVIERSVNTGFLDRALRGLAVPGACLAVGSVGLFVLLRWRPAPIGRLLAVALVLTAATVELQWGAWEFTPIVPEDEGFYPEHPSFEAMEPEVSKGVYRFAGTSLNVIRPNSAAFLDIADVRLTGPSDEKYRELMLAIDPQVFDRARLATWFTKELDPSSPGLDRSAVRFLVAPGAKGVLEAVTGDEVAVSDRGGLLLPATSTPVRGLRFNLDRQCRRGFLTVRQNDVVLGRRPLWQAESESFDVPIEDLSGPADLTIETEGCDITLPSTVTLLLASRDSTLRSIWADDAVIYERANARPRFEVASAVRGIADPDERLRYLTTSDDVKTVVLDQSTRRTELGGGSVELVEDEGDHLVLNVEADGSGYLVVRDVNAPGWKAIVNGRPVDILNADHAYRAVEVPDGVSTVRMTYLPDSRLIGLELAAVTVLALMTANVWERRSLQNSSNGGPIPERNSLEGVGES